MRLKRTAGTTCFAFPTITLDEQWVITGGTGRYAGASGKLARRGTGDVRFGTVLGTIRGTLKLD